MTLSLMLSKVLFLSDLRIRVFLSDIRIFLSIVIAIPEGRKENEKSFPVKAKWTWNTGRPGGLCGQKRYFPFLFQRLVFFRLPAFS